MFPAPSESLLVAVIAFVLTVVISLLKLVSRDSSQPALQFVEGFTEFPVDATAAWLSLAIGLLATSGPFGNIFALNLSIILACIAVQILSLKTLRAIMLSTETTRTKVIRVMSPTISWIALFVGLATVVAVAERSMASAG